MRLDLLAHGATAAVRAARFPDDESLESAARDMLRNGRSPRYDRILTSPAPAARETAAALGLDAVVELALRDCDYGRWRGLSLEAVAASRPKDLSDWLGDPDASAHGGETVSGLVRRMAAWLETLVESDGAMLAVTHAANLRAVLIAALGVGESAYWRIDVAPLTLMTLSGRDKRWNLKSFAPWRTRA